MRLVRALFAVALATSSVRAQAVPGDPVVERGHAVTILLGRGEATLVSTRTIENTGDATDVGVVSVGWPNGGVMTGLALQDRERWLPATLLDAEPAAALFTKLTEKGDGPAQPTALLDHTGTLNVFPLRPRSPRRARIEGLLAGTYSEGRYVFPLPTMGSANAPAVVTVLPATRGDLVFRDKKQVSPGSTFLLDAATELSVMPVHAPVMTMHVASPGTGKRALFHLGAEVAPKMSEAPKGARVVVILDASRSRSADAMQAERAVAATYLSLLPDARAQVITFDRRVDVRFDGFLPSAEAQARLWKMPLVRRNGSDLDLALARAVELFDVAGGTEPRRVVVLGDLLTRANLDVSPALRALADRGVVTHAAIVNEFGGGLTRDDEHSFSAAFRATGGLVWDLGAGDATKPRVLEELVRPLRLDKLKWEIPKVDATTLDLPVTLAEGEGHALTILTSSMVPGVNVRGESWSTKVAFGATPTEVENVRWAALAFTTGLEFDLSSDEKRVLAHRGHAVTDETSFVVVPPETRGSSEGLSDPRGIGLFGGSGGGGSRDGGIGHGTGRRGGGFDGAAKLAEMLRGAWVACGGKGAATLTIETTRDEVAAARVASLPDAAPATLSSCLVESAFSLDLPAEFVRPQATWQVRLGGE